MLSGEQLYAVTNVYNTGVAMGFAQAFASASRWSDMDTAYTQAREFWPGGPIAKGSLGAAITHDGKPLPRFPLSIGPYPRAFPDTYKAMRANEQTLLDILIARTSYAHYASLGALAAILEVNGHQAITLRGLPKRMVGWNMARDTLERLIPLASSICGRTPLDVTPLRDLKAAMSRLQGPHVIEAGGVGDAGKYLYRTAEKVRYAFGETIARSAESGLRGHGCDEGTQGGSATTHPFLLSAVTAVGTRWYYGAFPGVGTLTGEIRAVNVPAEHGFGNAVVSFLRPGLVPDATTDPRDAKQVILVPAGRSLEGTALTLFTGTPAKAVALYAASTTLAVDQLMLTITVSVP